MQRYHLALAVLCCIFAYQMVAFGSGPVLDTSFGSGGSVHLKFDEPVVLASLQRSLSEGRFFLSVTPTSDDRYFMERYLSNGQVDETYASRGRLNISGAPFTYTPGTWADSSGRFLLPVQGEGDFYRLSQFSPEGQPVPFWSQELKLPVPEFTDGQGRIYFETPMGGEDSSPTDYRIRRLSPDGVIDGGFNPDVLMKTFNIWIDPNFAIVTKDKAGRILISAVTLPEGKDNLIIRLLPDFTLDGSFGENGVYRVPMSILYRSWIMEYDHYLLLTTMDSEKRAVVVRLNSEDGRPDLSFGDHGVARLPIQATLVPLNSGRILGFTDKAEFELNGDGTLRTDVWQGGYSWKDSSTISGAMTDSEGRLLLLQWDGQWGDKNFWLERWIMD